jgi:hypothetical protein
MSLVGNLEDLSLGDIMQIISLSQKFGVLVLESERGSGRIVFRSGLVRGASLKGVDGHFSDLRSLVVGKGILDPAGFDTCAARASDLGLTIEEMLRSEASLDFARLDGLIQESVEAAVLEMFTWPSGDFSFDVRDEAEDGDPELLLKNGINAQYLAMEGMRVRDEAERDDSIATSTATSDVACEDEDLSAHEMFGVEMDGPLAEFVTPRSEAGSHGDWVAAGEILDEEQISSDTAADVVVAAVLDREEEPEVRAETPRRAHSTPLIVIDPEVAVLEWVKKALSDEFRQIHVFQQAEQGLMRIRQYLIRGELPVILISPEAEVDPLSGIRGLGDFVRRLKSQAPRLPIFGLVEGESQPEMGPQGGLDGVLARPAHKRLKAAAGDGSRSASEPFTKTLAAYLGG